VDIRKPYIISGLISREAAAIKAASYLMHGEGFSGVRNFLLDHSSLYCSGRLRNSFASIQ
jgi:hypothetical protein